MNEGLIESLPQLITRIVQLEQQQVQLKKYIAGLKRRLDEQPKPQQLSEIQDNISTPDLDLTGFDLSGVNLSRANLENANLKNANVIGTDFGENSGCPANLKGAIMPDGTVHE